MAWLSYVVLGLTAVVLFVIHKVRSANRRIRSVSDPSKVLPGVTEPWAFFKDSQGTVEAQAKRFRDYAQKYGSFYTYWLGPFHAVVITDPEGAKEVLHSSHNPDYERVEGPPFDRFGYELFGESIIQVKGRQNWKYQRDKLNPAFHHAKLKTLIPTFVNLAQRVTKHWVKKLEEGDNKINIPPWISGLTLDIIGKAGFGFEFGAIDNKLSVYQEAYNMVFAFFLDPMRIFLPGYEYLPLPRIFTMAKNVRLLNELMMSMIKDREAHPHDQPSDLLDLMLGSEGSGDPLTGKMLKDNLLLLFVAGHDTTAAAVSMALHLFSIHPEMQQRAAEEVAQVLGTEEKEITWDDLGKLEYLTAFIRETLRMYPPAALIVREAAKDLEIQGYHIPKGEFVMISLYSIHHNEQYWPDPYKFDPSRFFEEKGEHHPYAWVPFSAGPRSCLGMKFSMLEMKVVLSSILRRFVIRPDPTHKFEFDVSIFFRPKSPLPLIFEKRTQTQ